MAVCVALYAVLVVGLLLAGRRADARAVAGLVPDCVVLFKRLWPGPESSFEAVLAAAYGRSV